MLRYKNNAHKSTDKNSIKITYLLKFNVLIAN